MRLKKLLVCMSLLLLVSYTAAVSPARAIGPATIDPTLNPSTPTPLVTVPADTQPVAPGLPNWVFYSTDPFYWIALGY